VASASSRRGGRPSMALWHGNRGMPRRIPMPWLEAVDSRTMVPMSRYPGR
jgi:hypothetical protein